MRLFRAAESRVGILLIPVPPPKRRFMKQLNVLVGEEDLNLLKEKSRQEDSTVSSYVRSAIKEKAENGDRIAVLEKIVKNLRTAVIHHDKCLRN